MPGRSVSPAADSSPPQTTQAAADAESGAKVVFIASPNNPSGNLPPQAEIEELLKSGALVVVDEAYHEFGGETVAPLVPRNPNLVVLRTFSKWAGLAGLRVGYGAMSPELAARLMRIKPPYNVNAAAEVAEYWAADDKMVLHGGQPYVFDPQRGAPAVHPVSMGAFEIYAVTVDGVVIAGADAGNGVNGLVALTRDGGVVWTSPGSIHATIASDGTVVAWGNTIRGLDGATGTTRWGLAPAVPSCIEDAALTSTGGIVALQCDGTLFGASD